jgi:general secretion pathway protein I
MKRFPSPVQACFHPGAPQHRGGFTILEIIIAVGILLGSLTAIIQLISSGTYSSVQGKFRAAAVLMAESKLNEAISGAVPMQGSSAVPFEDAPEWSWEMSVEPSSLSDVLVVTVTVTRESEFAAERHAYSVSRMTRDPQVFLNAAMGD